MAYDIFLASAVEDRDLAKLIARRLRALKFKVWFDQKQTDDTFDQKDARDALNSQSMVVLWSEKAVESDFVRAAASVGKSRDGTLLQAALDDTVPYDPFEVDKNFKLDGMTSRTTPEGFYKLVEELGRRDGRIDLRAWMDFGSKDDGEKAAWLAAHPTDPLALAAEKARARKLETKPAPAAAAAGAAALAASSLKSASPAPVAPAAPAPRATAPKPAAAAAAAASMADDEIGIGWGLLLPVVAGIALMFLLARIWNSDVRPDGAMPAVANSVFAPTCPAGQAPATLFAKPPLEAGPIIVDTDDE
ncbi:MAG: toll/interleukin-1 receptor domain-containing protein [Pseudomonadota bacterium]